MYKKTTIFLLIVVLIFTLGSCKKKPKYESLFKDNLELEGKRKPPKNDINLISLSGALNYSTTYIESGIIVLTYSDASKTAYSLITEKTLFTPKKNINITVLNENGYPYINVLETTSNKRTIYDTFGNIVLPEGRYLHYDISGSPIYVNDNKNNTKITLYNELVYYVYLDENENPKENLSLYQVNINEQTRTLGEATIPEDSLDINKNKKDLTSINLKGYHAIILNDVYYIYQTKDNKNISSFNLRDKTILSGFDKRFILVDKQIVTSEDDYTYIDDEDNYINLKYESVDVLTGKFKDLDLNYVIDEITPLKDSKGNIKYGFVSVYHIKNKQLSENNNYYLIDRNGKILKDYRSLNIHNLTRLKGDYYYDSDSEYLFDNKLNPVIEIDKFLYGVNDHKFIIRGTPNSNDLGMIDYEYNRIIPVNNVVLDNEFYDNKIYALDRFGDSFFYNTKGEKTPISGDYQQLSLGLLIKLNHSKIDIQDYNLNTLQTINNIKDYNHDVKEINLIFGQYKVLEITKADNTKVYILADVKR